MGNYLNKLRWKITRANNPPQPTHQVTIEIRPRKSFAQERFKSNPEFRNQIIVYSIKFWKCFAESTTPIALPKKPPSQQFIASAEVSNTARCSSKTNELRDTDPTGCRTRNTTTLFVYIHGVEVKICSVYYWIQLIEAIDQYSITGPIRNY